MVVSVNRSICGCPKFCSFYDNLKRKPRIVTCLTFEQLVEGQQLKGEEGSFAGSIGS